MVLLENLRNINLSVLKISALIFASIQRECLEQSAIIPIMDNSGQHIWKWF